MTKHSILLTGATGYVGGRLLRTLESRGHEVHCVARRPGYLSSRVAETTTVFEGDVLDKQSLPAAFEGIEIAYYLVHSMGAGKYLRRQNPAIRLHPLEPAESPTLSTGHKVGQHRIQGVSDEFIPAILELEKLDDVVGVADGDAILMAQKLAAGLGLAVGISSGANFIGALMLQNQMGADAVVVTVFPDDNKKYLNTDLLREEEVEPGYLTPEVELTNYHAFKRVCHTCFEAEDGVVQLGPLRR